MTDAMTRPEPENPPAEYRDPDPFRVEAADHVFTFLPRGLDRLEALLTTVAGARQSLRIFYYMFQDDESGVVVRDALVNAARRGVDVHLIVDDFGTDAPRSFFRPLVEAGGKFEIVAARWNVRYLIRNHQKFLIADGTKVITGGANVSDHYFKPPDDNGWCDLAVSIEGPVVEKFTEWFSLVHEWTDNDSAQFLRIRQMVKDWEPGEGPVQLLVGGPLIRKGRWAWRFRHDMIKATRLDMVTAYFTPPRSTRRVMARVARRGKARLIAAGKSDIGAAIDVARLLYKDLLGAGVKIFEFQPCKLHMKLFVVDSISYFGSANLDKRSVRLNVELMVRVDDEELAARLRELIDHLEGASMPVTQKWYERKANCLNRVRWRLTYMAALADYRVTRTLTE